MRVREGGLAAGGAHAVALAVVGVGPGLFIFISAHARVRKGTTKWYEKRPPQSATPRKSGGSASDGWAERRPVASCSSSSSKQHAKAKA